MENPTRFASMNGVAYSGATFWPETTWNNWNAADPCGQFWDQISCLMHWKYPFPTSYIYIHCSEFSQRSNWLKIGDFWDENHQSRAKGETKAHTTEKRMFWSRPSFSVFRTIRKKINLKSVPSWRQSWGGAHQVHLPFLIWTHHLRLHDDGSGGLWAYGHEVRAQSKSFLVSPLYESYISKHEKW